MGQILNKQCSTCGNWDRQGAKKADSMEFPKEKLSLQDFKKALSKHQSCNYCPMCGKKVDDKWLYLSLLDAR